MRNLTTIILAFCTNIALSGEPDKDLHNKCIYPTVMLESLDPNCKNSGTGVIVKSVKEDEKYVNYVFTCAHILQKTQIKIVLSKREIYIPATYDYIVRVGNYENWSKIVSIDEYKCKVLYKGDNEDDIAIVKFTTDKQMPVAELEEDPEIYIGNEVCRVGCGLGEPFRVDFGRVTSLAESKDRNATKNTHRVSIATLPGDSGGPVYNEKNKLIGITQMIRGINLYGKNMPVFHMAYVIPLKRYMESEDVLQHLIHPPKIEHQ